MKNKFFIKIALIFAAIIVVGLMIWGYQSFIYVPDFPGAITLNQGTQTKFQSLSIGLSSVDNHSAWLSFHNDGEDSSTQMQLLSGDKISVYGYEIEVKLVKKVYNFSFAPGASHGVVEFVVIKN